MSASDALFEARALGERWAAHPDTNGYGAALLAVLDTYGAIPDSRSASRVEAALGILERERDGRGNLQMGRAPAAQVIELLRAAVGS